MCNKSLKKQLEECAYKDNIFDVTFIRRGEVRKVRALTVDAVIAEVPNPNNAQVFQSKVFKSELIIVC